MINCQEARNAITILEVECPQCGDGVEVFVKDGVICIDSVCTKCGNPASFTQRISKDKKRIVVGTTDAYQARCRRCYKKPRK